MRPTLLVVASTAAMAAALTLSGCAPQAAAPVSTAPPAPSVPASAVAPGPHDPALPDPGALTDVLYRLADPVVPGTDKLNLVHGATDSDAATLDRFATALQDNGYRPATFEAGDVGWSAAGAPDDVLATVTVSKDRSDDGFSLPMEFRRTDQQWQLSKSTFELLMDTQPTESDVPEPPG